MNSEDLQIIEDFNAQTQEIAAKAAKLITYLSECIALDSLNECIEFAQKGIENFDIYTFIDFIEADQADHLSQTVEIFMDKLEGVSPLSADQQHFIEQAEYYISICRSRTIFLDTIQNDPKQTKYSLLFGENNSTQSAATAAGKTSQQQNQAGEDNLSDGIDEEEEEDDDQLSENGNHESDSLSEIEVTVPYTLQKLAKQAQH